MVFSVSAEPAQVVAVKTDHQGSLGLTLRRIRKSPCLLSRFFGYPGFRPDREYVSRNGRDRQVIKENFGSSWTAHQVDDQPLEVRPLQADRTSRRGPQDTGLTLDRRLHVS